MYIDDFKQVVASFVGRDPSYFTYNEDGTPGPDKLLIAVNNAKMFLQRQVDFEYSRCAVDLLCDPVEGVIAATGVDTITGQVKRIKKVTDVFFQHHYKRMRPLRQMSRRTMVGQVRLGMDKGIGDPDWFIAPRPDDINGGSAICGATFRDPIMYLHGRRMFIYPNIATAQWQDFSFWYPQTYIQTNWPNWNWVPGKKLPPIPLSCDIVEFLPPYGNLDGPVNKDTGEVHATDFILEFCYDYMLFRTLSELNAFLKDTEQVTLSQSKMNEALQNIREWNADLIQGDDNNLG